MAKGEEDSGKGGDSGGATIIIKKIKKGGHGGHHGGAWKVAYADFVTAMMAFFMVMWLMGSDEETKAAIEAYFQGKTLGGDTLNAAGSFNGGDASMRNEGGQGRFEEKDLESPYHTAPIYKEEQAVLKDLSDAYEGSAFTKDTDGDVVKYEIKDRIVFTEGSVDIPLNVANRKLLDSVVDSFKQHDGMIVIEGHSDGNQDWALAFGRALAVRHYLIDMKGVRGNKLVPMAGFTAPASGQVMGPDEVERGTVKFILKRVRPD